jgi:hypothetical protein
MYFDDYIPGTVSTPRADTVSEAAIIEFARQFDPQDFHFNPAVAAHGPYGAVIASGWHTCAMAGHAMVTGYLAAESSLPAPGRRRGVLSHTPAGRRHPHLARDRAGRAPLPLEPLARNRPHSRRGGQSERLAGSESDRHQPDPPGTDREFSTGLAARPGEHAPHLQLLARESTS